MLTFLTIARSQPESGPWRRASATASRRHGTSLPGAGERAAVGFGAGTEDPRSDGATWPPCERRVASEQKLLLRLFPSGATRFQGTINQPGTVTVNGQAATATSTNFTANPVLSSGMNTVTVIAKNGGGHTTTNNFSVSVPPTATTTPTYDLNGNLTNDGKGKTYEWDAKDELTAINYAAPVQERLLGTIIGTPGSYANNGNTIAKAFNGIYSDSFNGPTQNGVWLGLDLGAGNTAPVTQIRFTPRNGFTARMTGGLFQGSNTADFSSGVTTLATISTTPPSGTNTVAITGGNVFRYVRYLGPNGSYADIAELEFDTAISRSEFTYDGLSRRVKLVDKNSAGTMVSTQQHLWLGNIIAEERDKNNTVTKRFFTQGEQINGASFFYAKDHLGSTRELMDSNGTIVSRYDYDPYGRVTKLQGNTEIDATFQYAGYLRHRGSGLNLTKYRAYDAQTGRWLSRDPIAEAGGINLYGYVGNSPINGIDPLGLDPVYHYSPTPPQIFGPTANPGTYVTNLPNLTQSQAMSLLGIGPPQYIYTIHADPANDLDPLFPLNSGPRLIPPTNRYYTIQREPIW